MTSASANTSQPSNIPQPLISIKRDSHPSQTAYPTVTCHFIQELQAPSNAQTKPMWKKNDGVHETQIKFPNTTCNTNPLTWLLISFT